MDSQDTKINKDMTLLDILYQYKGIESVFRHYDDAAGECICCNCLFDSLEGMCSKYHLDVKQLMNDLDQYLKRHPKEL